MGNSMRGEEFSPTKDGATLMKKDEKNESTKDKRESQWRVTKWLTKRIQF